MNPLMLDNGVRVYTSPYVPMAYPTKREMRRWRWWGRLFGRPKPQPQEQILMIGDDAWMLPRTYAKLYAEILEQRTTATAVIRLDP